MIFADAVNNMLLGKKLVRPSWNSYYVMIVSGQAYIWMVGNTNQKQDPNVIAYTPSIDDILASDWTVKLN